MAYVPYRRKGSKKPLRKPYRKGAKGYSSGVKKLANDVRVLKRQVAGEKKTFTDGLITGSALGQCNVNSDSAWAQDMTPRPPSSSSYQGRNGRQIKLTSCSIQYQISQQVNTSQPINIDIYIVRIVGDPLNVSTAYGNFMLPNPITGVRDLMSTRNISYFKDYRVIKKIRCYLPQDQASGNQAIKTGRVNLKLNQYLNFLNDTNTITSGQLMMFAYASSGNSGGVNSTLPNVVEQGDATGCVIQTYTKFWYQDN